MKNIRFFAACMLAAVSISTHAIVPEGVEKQTFVFSIKETDTLRLDKYDYPALTIEKKPCVLYVFGGGFASGQRDGDFHEEYLSQLARKGYVAVSIDYRLGMKSATQADNDTGMVTLMLVRALAMAVEDFYDATVFVYDHADEWNINREMIIANGSSAGAITVLQGEYLRSVEYPLSGKLPRDFNYGGVISFAGCIFSTPEFPWKKTPAPMLLFHGDADRNVPFGTLEMGGFAMFGSNSIATYLSENQLPYHFYKVENAAHEIAGSPMTDNLEEMFAFIDRFVVKKIPLMVNTVVRQIGKEEMKKDFTIEDYIGSNYHYPTNEQDEDNNTDN